MSDYNPYLKRAFLDVVRNQLRDDDPPETRQTLNRLLAAGYSRQEAIERIGAAVVEMIWEVWHEHKEFDNERYRALLDAIE